MLTNQYVYTQPGAHACSVSHTLLGTCLHDVAGGIKVNLEMNVTMIGDGAHERTSEIGVLCAATGL